MTVSISSYIAGLTQSEAMTYIQNLPGLTQKEFDSLIRAANRKPMNRQRGHPAGTRNVSMSSRIRDLVRFLREHPGASLNQISGALKANRVNAHYVVCEAIRQGRVAREKGRRGYTYRVGKGGRHG